MTKRRIAILGSIAAIVFALAGTSGATGSGARSPELTPYQILVPTWNGKGNPPADPQHPVIYR